MEEKRKVLHYRASVKGVWGRKRKEDFMSLFLAKSIDPNAPKSMDELLPILRERLAELKVKPGANIRVTEDPIETDGVFETFVLMSERTLMRAKVDENGALKDPLTGNLF